MSLIKLLIFFTYVITSSFEQIVCEKKQLQIKNILRGNLKNILTYKSGTINSSRTTQINAGGNIYGVLFRDHIYYVNAAQGQIFCNSINCEIKIDLMQSYELNTLIIWFYDLQFRIYYTDVFAVCKKKLVKISDYLEIKQGAFKIKFKSQRVEQFIIKNTNGNTISSNLNIIKAISFYQYEL